MNRTQAQVAELEGQLRSRADAARAEGEKRYLKSSLDFLGVSMPQIRSLVRELSRDAPEMKRSHVVALARELWDSDLHERKMAAVVLLEQHVAKLQVADLRVIESFIRTSHTWAYVDGLAGSVTGDIVLAHPEAVQVLDRWARDDDFWVRRSAMLALLRSVKRGQRFELFAGYADEMLDEKEFFIRKAIGWVLREFSKRDPQTAYRWVRPRVRRMSGVTFREAVKYLEPEQRDELSKARLA